MFGDIGDFHRIRAVLTAITTAGGPGYWPGGRKCSKMDHSTPRRTLKYYAISVHNVRVPDRVAAQGSDENDRIRNPATLPGVN
jgi:hypothetical protein